MRIGAHVSVAKGFVEALDYAESVGCECLQVFAKSPRQWKAPAIDAHKAAEFVAARRARQAGPVFTHTAYLINLTTTDPVLATKSVDALADELVRGSRLGAQGVVTHVGNDPDADPAAAAERCAAAIRLAFEIAGDEASGVRLLIENTAGAGRTFGGPVSQLAAIVDASGLSPEAIGICLDTCHAFAYGYGLDTEQGWLELIDEAQDAIGLDRLGLIHANDCLFERGSRRDRHAWIGEGHIGVEGFTAMLCEPRIAHVPVVTEMPGEVPDKDLVNVGRLRELRAACAPSH